MSQFRGYDPNILKAHAAENPGWTERVRANAATGFRLDEDDYLKHDKYATDEEVKEILERHDSGGLDRIDYNKWGYLNSEERRLARTHTDGRIDWVLKRLCRKDTRKLIRDGILMVPDECGKCGSHGIIEAHHEDYSRPEQVDWLCTFCHAKRHMDINSEPGNSLKYAD